MTNKKKKLTATLASVMMLGTILSACGSDNNNTNTAPEGSNTGAAVTDTGAPDTSKEVKLKMLLIGSQPADYDKVFGELNTLLKEKINATVETEFLDWADWTQKYPLKFAANEDFDLVYTSNWAFYNDQALKGGFLELTEDMLSKYMPQTWEAMPQVNWDQAKVDGKIYMIPNNNVEVIDKVVLYREDLRKKYNLAEINSPESYADYLKTIAKEESAMSAYGAKPADGFKWHELDKIMIEQQNDWRMVDATLLPLAFKLDDTTGKVFNIYETPEYRELLTYYKDLADNGAWSKNIVSNKNDVWQDIKAGKVSSYTHNLGTVAANITEMRRDKPDVELAIADLTPDKKKTAAIATQNGMAIHATSKNAERSLMLIDLLQNDKEIHDLTMYGIAGTNYIPEGDDKYSAGPSAESFPTSGFSNWGWNSELNRQDASYPKEADDMFNVWQSNVHHFPLETYVFDSTAVKNEVANIGNVMLRYAIPLEYGLIADLDKGVAELNKQLKSAGIEKVQAEIQSQIDAFLAAQQ